jgi:hypothetical protein
MENVQEGEKSTQKYSDLGINSICFLSNIFHNLIESAWSARRAVFELLGLFHWFHYTRQAQSNYSSLLRRGSVALREM